MREPVFARLQSVETDPAAGYLAWAKANIGEDGAVIPASQDEEDEPQDSPWTDEKLTALDTKIVAFLSDRHVTLWGEQWTITEERGRNKAREFLMRTITEVLEGDDFNAG